MVVSNSQFEIKSGKKYRETIYIEDLIRDVRKGIPCYKS